jgi:hypothetical protein
MAPVSGACFKFKRFLVRWGAFEPGFGVRYEIESESCVKIFPIKNTGTTHQAYSDTSEPWVQVKSDKQVAYFILVAPNFGRGQSKKSTDNSHLYKRNNNPILINSQKEPPIEAKTRLFFRKKRLQAKGDPAHAF